MPCEVIIVTKLFITVTLAVYVNIWMGMSDNFKFYFCTGTICQVFSDYWIDIFLFICEIYTTGKI